MPKDIVALLTLLVGGRAEQYVGQLLADAATVYLAQRDRLDVDRWLRLHGFSEGP